MHLIAMYAFSLGDQAPAWIAESVAKLEVKVEPRPTGAMARTEMALESLAFTLKSEALRTKLSYVDLCLLLTSQTTSPLFRLTFTEFQTKLKEVMPSHESCMDMKSLKDAVARVDPEIWVMLKAVSNSDLIPPLSWWRSNQQFHGRLP